MIQSVVPAAQKVLISGIGIAGPTLAYWLGRSGFRSTLVENAPRLRTGGYIIDFWGRGFDVAEKMGILPAIKREGYDVEKLRIVNERGQRIGGFDVDAFRRVARGRYVSIPRGELARLLYGKVEAGCETIFGDSVSRIEQQADHVEVGFLRGAPRRFDLVIGADGLHSTVRKLAFGDQSRFEKYLGYGVAAFVVRGYRPRDEDVYVGYNVPGKQAARFAMRGDRTMFLFIFEDRHNLRFDPQDTPANEKILRNEFQEAGWECPQILAAMESCGEIYFDRVSQIRMDRWSQGRVGLVGDAAFCPSLLAGQGAALAMLAAYILAGELSRMRSRPQEAFKRYEDRLRPFIERKQEDALQFAGILTPKTRVGLFFRNQVTKLLGAPFFAERLLRSTLSDPIDLPDYPVPEDPDR